MDARIVTDLKKELEAISAGTGPSFVDAPARRKNGKVFFRNRELHDFAGLDVLGVSQDRRVKRSAQEAIEAFGLGSSASRRNAGTVDSHLLCEKSLSTFLGYERALLFSGRNQVVFSLLATVLREQDQVFCDEDYAGLLSDVCLLLNCPIEVVPLEDLKKLDELFEVPVVGRRRFVVADTISAFTGRKIDVQGLATLCTRRNVTLIVDESFALGVIGARGAGVSEASLLSTGGVVSPRPFCVVSELGFGLGSFGACLVGPAVLIDALTAREIFPPSV